MQTTMTFAFYDRHFDESHFHSQLVLLIAMHCISAKLSLFLHANVDQQAFESSIAIKNHLNIQKTTFMYRMRVSALIT